jgi:small subunit ribosomal protein S6
MVNNEQTLITRIHEPKTLSETMKDQQSYYETMYILRPDIAEDEVTTHINKYNKLLEEFGGTILDSQMRGKRRLAYQIAKHREGVYVQLSHQGDGQHIFKIEKAMRLSEDVIRYMTVKQEGPLPTPRPSNKSTSQIENKDDADANVESKEKQPVTSPDASTSKKDDTETKDNAES